MNVTERVASLEALLARVKKNAAEPRALSPRAAPLLHADRARAQELSPFDDDAGSPGEPNAWDTEETAIFTYPPSFQDAPHQPLPRPMEPAPHAQATAKADPAKQPAPNLTPTGTARVKIDPSKMLAALRDAPVVAKGDTDRSPIDFSAALKAATERRGPPVEVRDAAPLPAAEPVKAPPAAAAATPAPKQAERSPQPPAAKIEAPLPRVEPVAAKVEPKPAAPKADPRPIAPRAEPVAAAAKAEPIAAAPRVEPIAAAAKAEPKPIAAREEPKAAPFVPVKAVSAAALSASRRTAAKTLMGGLTAEDLKLPVEPSKEAGEPSAAKAESVLEEALLASIVMPGGGPAKVEARAEAPVASFTDPVDPFPGKPLVVDEPKAAAAAPVEPAKKAEPAAEAAPTSAKVTTAPADADVKKAEPATAKEDPAAAKTGETPQTRREDTTPSKRYMPPTPSAEPPKRARGKLIAGAIAALLVGGGLFYGMREGWFDAGTGPEPIVPPPPSAVPITTGPTTTTPATVSAVPATSGTPEAADAGLAADAAATADAATADAAAADAATADAAGAIVPGGPDPASLPADMGYITITSPAEGNLYLNGKFAGRAGERIQTPCGAKFARLAKAADPPAAIPAFLTTGETIVIPCRKAASVALRVGQPAWNQPAPEPY